MKSNRLIAVVGAACLALASLIAAAAPAYAADLTLTAANVVAGTNARIDRTSYAGETIAAGKTVYKATVGGKWMLADSDSATAEVRQAEGVALNGASNNQPLDVQTGGDITIGATITAGAPYYLSNTPGGIIPSADLSTGEYVDLICIAKSTTVCALQFAYTGVATP